MCNWRTAGLNYVNVSNIAGKIVRLALKSEFRNQAAKRDLTHIKFTPWLDGKPQRDKVY